MSAGVVCLGAVMVLKNVLKWDDSLDVIGVHLVGGALGTLLAGVLAHSAFGLFGGQENFSILRQILVQLIGVAVTIVYTMAMSWVILAIVNAMVRQRVSEETLTDGLDKALHGEWGYVLDGPSSVVPTDNFAPESPGQRATGGEPREGEPILSPNELRDALSAESPGQQGETRRESEPFMDPPTSIPGYPGENQGRQAAAETRRESEAVLSSDELRAALSPEDRGPRE